MKETTLTIKTNKKLRDEVKRTADEIGVPVTVVINSMLKQFVRDKEVTLSAYPQLRPEKAREYRLISEEMDSHPERFKTFSSVEELFADMDKMREKSKKKVR